MSRWIGYRCSGRDDDPCDSLQVFASGNGEPFLDGVGDDQGGICAGLFESRSGR